MEMEHAHPMEISIRGFDASHLLPLSTNWFFRLNGKQPRAFDHYSKVISVPDLPTVDCAIIIQNGDREARMKITQQRYIAKFIFYSLRFKTHWM